MERQPSGKCDRHGTLLRQLLVSHGGVLAEYYGSGGTKVLLLHFGVSMDSQDARDGGNNFQEGLL